MEKKLNNVLTINNKIIILRMYNYNRHKLLKENCWTILYIIVCIFLFLNLRLKVSDVKFCTTIFFGRLTVMKVCKNINLFSNVILMTIPPLYNNKKKKMFYPNSRVGPNNYNVSMGYKIDVLLQVCTQRNPSLILIKKCLEN